MYNTRETKIINKFKLLIKNLYGFGTIREHATDTKHEAIKMHEEEMGEQVESFEDIADLVIEIMQGEDADPFYCSYAGRDLDTLKRAFSIFEIEQMEEMARKSDLSGLLEFEQEHEEDPDLNDFISIVFKYFYLTLIYNELKNRF